MKSIFRASHQLVIREKQYRKGWKAVFEANSKAGFKQSDGRLGSRIIQRLSSRKAGFKANSKAGFKQSDGRLGSRLIQSRQE